MAYGRLGGDIDSAEDDNNDDEEDDDDEEEEEDGDHQDHQNSNGGAGGQGKGTSARRVKRVGEGKSCVGDGEAGGSARGKRRVHTPGGRSEGNAGDGGDSSDDSLSSAATIVEPTAAAAAGAVESSVSAGKAVALDSEIGSEREISERDVQGNISRHHGRHNKEKADVGVANTEDFVSEDELEPGAVDADAELATGGAPAKKREGNAATAEASQRKQNANVENVEARGDTSRGEEGAADYPEGRWADEEFEDEKDDDTFVGEGKEETNDLEGGAYVVGSHIEDMMGGMHTELVFNAANSADVGVRVGIVEEGRLVELWHEHGTESGKGMRVGDVYLGVVAKVISGMQGVLVDVTGRGPPYSLMQKGVDEPALAWCRADPLHFGRSEDEDEDADESEGRTEEGDAGAEDSGAGKRSDESSLSRQDVEEVTAMRPRPRAGRWEAAWADGVGVSGDDDRSVDMSGDDTDDFTNVNMSVDEGEGANSDANADATDISEGRRTRPSGGLNSAKKDREAARAKAAHEVAARGFDNSFDDDAYPRSRRRTDELFSNYNASRGESSRGGSGNDIPCSWIPFKDHVEMKGHDTALTGGNKVVEHWLPGMPVVVQVTRLGLGHKGPRVTARPTLPGRNVVLCPDGEGVYVSRKLVGQARAYVKSIGTTVVPDDCALIMRTEAAGVSKQVLEMDITSLATDWMEVRDRATAAVTAAGEQGRSPMPRRLLDAATVEQVLVRDLFGERIARLTVDTVQAHEAIVEDLRRTGATEETVRRVQLHTGTENIFHYMGLGRVVDSTAEERVLLRDESLPGAHLVIQRTEALTAVDVNAGRAAFISDCDNESVAVRVNAAAAEEMALQLRLRDIGGLVMIDFIDMTSREHRKEVEAAFLKAAQRDRAQVTFLPISPLGVMEVARERLQGNQSGKHVVADIKGMPINPDRPFGGPRRMRGPRPPPWERSGLRGNRGNRGGGRRGYNSSRGDDGYSGRGRADTGGVRGVDDFDADGGGRGGGDRSGGRDGGFAGQAGRGWRTREEEERGRGWHRDESYPRRDADGADRKGDDSGSYHSGSYYSARRTSERGPSSSFRERGGAGDEERADAGGDGGGGRGAGRGRGGRGGRGDEGWFDVGNLDR